MTVIDKDSLCKEMNRLGQARRPFLWGISYDMREGFIIDNPDRHPDVLWHIGDYGNDGCLSAPDRSPSLRIIKPVKRNEYSAMFAKIQSGLKRGDSFLANLTSATEVECSGSFRDVFLASSAPFRLMLGDGFVCFSPEPFVRISGREISTFPMKGTADASLPQAEKRLLDNYKEQAEHFTIVDLMRNDLNSIAENVSVRRFRYVETIATATGKILQTSSEITGILPEGKEYRFGDVILPLLPAGSITGAPKHSTVSLIDSAETVKRGWYTGVFGYFDGMVMQTAVMIRCLQRDASRRIFFHSGGGITVNSSEEDEYNELITKVRLTI